MKLSTGIAGWLSFVSIVSITVFFAGCAAETDIGAGTDALIVYKNPGCECCDKWIQHMQAAGFNVTAKNQNDVTDVKNRFGIRSRYSSCHTAVSATGGYVFEGHIPASIIKQFLAAPPAGAKGLLVPGMPVGSPGMEIDGKRSSYDVLLLKAEGNIEIYSHVAGNEGV